MLVNIKIVVARHVDVVERDVKCLNLEENHYGNEIDASIDDDLSDNVFESVDETKKQQCKIKDNDNE